MKKPIFINIYVGALLICGGFFRTAWSMGGPSWMYWIGNILFSLFFLLPCVVIFLAPQLALCWLQSTYGKPNKNELNSWEDLTLSKKILIYAFAIADAMVGITILLSILVKIITCQPNSIC